MDGHHHDHHGGSGFFNGFLLGAIIGAAVVFFLFTDKGKKLLNTILEEGSEGFSQLQGILDEEFEEEDEAFDDMVEEESPMRPIPHKEEVAHLKPLPENHTHADHHEPVHENHVRSESVHPHPEYAAPAHKGVKRFFRGVKK